MNPYIVGAELPDLELEWTTRTGTVIDFSAGWTFTLKIGHPAAAAMVTKTTGITGAATLPNIVVAWAAAELDTVPPGRDLTLQLVARHTATGKDRALQRPIRFAPTIL